MRRRPSSGRSLMNNHYPILILSALLGYALLILWGTWHGPLELPGTGHDAPAVFHSLADGISFH